MKALLLSFVFCAVQLGSAAEKGFQRLFNGDDLAGCEGVGGQANNWEIKDGTLSCTGRPCGDAPRMNLATG